MSLDITFIERKNVLCPHCGEVATTEDIDAVESGGRCWYDVLESIGYYVPHDKCTEENDWYGKDMILTKEQATEVYQKIRADIFGFYEGVGVMKLIAQAIMNENQVVVNANW